MKALLDLFQKSHHISLMLFKLMIPIIIVIKILEHFGLVMLLSEWLQPVMQLVGLPGEMGLVWATTLVTNLYGGLVVYASLASEVDMTVAQVTIISSMMLIAHALPVEARIAQKAGVNITLTVSLRFGMAVLFGIIFNQIYLAGDWLQQPSQLLWTPDPVDGSILAWLQDQVITLGLIYLIVLVLVLFLDLLKRAGVIQLINNLLRPVLTMEIG